MRGNTRLHWTRSRKRFSNVAGEVEATIRAVPVALEKFRSAQAAVLRNWPDNVEYPWADELGTARIERVINEAFRPFAPLWIKEAHEDWDLTRKLENIRETVADFAKFEADGYGVMIARLRAQPAPASEREESKAA